MGSAVGVDGNVICVLSCGEVCDEQPIGLVKTLPFTSRKHGPATPQKPLQQASASFPAVCLKIGGGR